MHSLKFNRSIKASIYNNYHGHHHHYYYYYYHVISYHYYYHIISLLLYHLSCDLALDPLGLWIDTLMVMIVN